MRTSYTDFVMAVLFGVGHGLDCAAMMIVRASFESGRSVRATVAELTAGA
jgi:hypothetical protein